MDREGVLRPWCIWLVVLGLVPREGRVVVSAAPELLSLPCEERAGARGQLYHLPSVSFPGTPVTQPGRLKTAVHSPVLRPEVQNPSARWGCAPAGGSGPEGDPSVSSGWALDVP